MVPRIHAKYRKRRGVPYAIEQLSGRQYRCRHCNEIFFSEKHLDIHIRNVSSVDDSAKKHVAPACPALSSSVLVSALYTYDLTDKMKKQWLKLKKDDEYDGL
jgi:hypothetical protein